MKPLGPNHWHLWVRSPTPPVVCCQSFSGQREMWEADLLPRTLQALWPWAGEWAGVEVGQAEGCVLQSSRALTMAAHCPGPGLKQQQSLSLSLPPWPAVAAVSMGCRPGNLAPIWVAWGVWGPAESWVPGPLSDDSGAGSGNLTLRVPPAGICLFSWAWALARGSRLGTGRRLLGRVTSPYRDLPLLLPRTWTSEGKNWALELVFPCQNREYVSFSGGLQECHDLTSLQEQRIWHQEVCNS